MNNSNGQALLARIRHGALVSIRAEDGSIATGRATWCEPAAEWRLRSTRADYVITAVNLLSVRP